MEGLFEELGIPRKFIRSTSQDDRFIVVVHKTWLRSLVKHSKVSEFDDIKNVWSFDDVPEPLTKVFIRIFKKLEAKAIPLPRVHTTNYSYEPRLLFPQLMQYISHTNYKNLWKEAYKKYNTAENKNTQIVLSDYNDVLREVISRTYGCKIIGVDGDVEEKTYDCHGNIFPAVCGVESLNAIFLIHVPYIEHTLNDCVTFSPSILERCHTKPLFLVYQLINTLKSLHERSLTMGDVTLNDIYLTDDLWLYVFPALSSNIYVQELPKNEGKFNLGADCSKTGHKFDAFKCVQCGIKTYDRVQVSNESLEKLCELWVNGQISNYTYLMSLNNLAGRKYGDPNCHYVFPWVTDFSSRCGKNWRDLKKSKYRLNKGDRQLDLTYENTQTRVSHHVSDVLSSITYYVYMSRRTPKGILCKNVRTVWVPAEYPSSIQRLQEWTPDECIPEFFSDPTVFKSIHDDLDDLEVPNWCASPEEFVERHREILESQHVSERLHQWIDLTFGYKLSGNAAVKAKNVCLHLVDGHTNLTSSGVVQLFTSAHPPKAVNLPFWGKSPPKLYIQKKSKSRDRSSSSATVSLETSRSEEEDPLLEEETLLAGRSPLVLSRLLSRSRSSLNEDKEKVRSASSSGQRSASLGPKSTTFTQVTIKKTSVPVTNAAVVIGAGLICLPKEFNPAQALSNLENQHGFYGKTFHPDEGRRYNFAEQKRARFEVEKIQNAFTNRLFESRGTTKSFSFPIDNQLMSFRSRKNFKQENQVSCNYVEIIAARRIKELQILGCLIIEIFLPHRIALTILSSCKNEIPSCIKNILNLLLQPSCTDLDNFKYPTVTPLGLPPPSAHLLLEPLLHSLVPFNENFLELYQTISQLKEFERVNDELEILYHFDCDGTMCPEYEDREREKLTFSQNVGECKVKACAKHLESLLENLNPSKDFEVVLLIVPHVRKLIEEPPTAVLAAWYLFDPIARVLGPEKTSDYLLDPILKLYENDPSDVAYNAKIAKLYHRSFLLRSMVRFGLRRFLEHFVTLLVEAVGGYKDFEKLDFVPHSHSEKINRKTSHLRTIDNEPPLETSPSDDSTESERNVECFEFEEESDAIFEQDEIETVAVTSPTIPIPKNKDFAAISCDVGSKNDEFVECNKKKKTEVKIEAKISHMSADSLIWLSHRLGPVLTARYLSRNLLKMLTLCYVGRENLIGCSDGCIEGIDLISVARSRVVGDKNAAKVLNCLISIATLYGEQIILLQYLPHMSELIALCKRKLTANLEGGLISCLSLLKHIIPYITDSTLMDQLQDVILKSILYPTIRLLGSTKSTFPNGALARNVLARKYLDTLYVLSIRMGADMTRTHLAVPALQRFFLIFDKISENASYSKTNVEMGNKENLTEDCNFLEIRRDGTTAEWAIGGRPVQISHVRVRDSDSTDSISPPPQNPTITNADSITNQALDELGLVFTAELAHTAYTPFLRQMDASSMESSLKNHATIRELCREREFELKRNGEDESRRFEPVSSYESNYASSVGSNVAIVGNRIDFPEDDGSDILSHVGNKMENNVRHLRGNWLAYWEHEIGRSDKDFTFNFKQIKLQSFAGHTHGVKSLLVLDNENSFLSGSRDKTVKLWSLRSQGDGGTVTTCQFTYSGHKKSILGLTFLEGLRLVASCDNVVHLWDPFMGISIAQLESPRYTPVNVLKTLPAPSSLLFAATTEGTLRVIDARLCTCIHELKVSVNSAGLIRTLAVSPSGNWIATGQSSGQITVLDTRTGLVVSTWRAHEDEVLQLVPVDENTLISTSLDQNVCVWNVHDGRFEFNLKGATEPVHCLNVYNNQPISGTSANRIGVHTSVDPNASFSSTKLRPDAFKGLLTKMVVLPLNRLLLLGADNGNIHLLC